MFNIDKHLIERNAKHLSNVSRRHDILTTQADCVHASKEKREKII